MTKQSDALFAFSGILKALEESVYKEGMFWALPHADLNWALLWNGQSKNPRREGFPTRSWLSWQGGIWPGQPEPDGPQDQHKYPFDLKMWKSSSNGPEKIFETFVNSLAPKERLQLRDDPISGVARVEDTNCLERLSKIDLTERERLLCVESFILRFSPCVWVPENPGGELNDRFLMRVEEAFILISVWTSSNLRHESKRQGNRIFLLARNVITNDNKDYGITYHLLMLEPKDNFFERVCVVRMSIRTDELWILRSLGLARTEVLLGYVLCDAHCDEEKLILKIT